MVKALIILFALTFPDRSVTNKNYPDANCFLVLDIYIAAFRSFHKLYNNVASFDFDKQTWFFAHFERYSLLFCSNQNKEFQLWTPVSSCNEKEIYALNCFRLKP